MLHLTAQPTPETAPQPYAEAVSRLASIRHALRLVGPFGGGPASDPSDDAEVAAAWDSADGTKQQLFDRRTERMVGAAAQGVEALLSERQKGNEPHAAASQLLIEEIRRELRDVAGIILD